MNNILQTLDMAVRNKVYKTFSFLKGFDFNSFIFNKYINI